MFKVVIKVLLNFVLVVSELLVWGGWMDIGGEENEGYLEIVV